MLSSMSLASPLPYAVLQGNASAQSSLTSLFAADSAQFKQFYGPLWHLQASALSLRKMAWTDLFLQTNHSTPAAPVRGQKRCDACGAIREESPSSKASRGTTAVQAAQSGKIAFHDVPHLCLNLGRLAQRQAPLPAAHGYAQHNFAEGGAREWPLEL